MTLKRTILTPILKEIIPAAEVLCRAEENAVGDYFGQKVAVLGGIAHILPVAVLKDDGLASDIVQAGIQQEHVLQKDISANQAVVEAETGHSKHQEVGPLMLVQAQQQLRFEERVGSQQRLKTRNKDILVRS